MYTYFLDRGTRRPLRFGSIHATICLHMKRLIASQHNDYRLCGDLGGTNFRIEARTGTTSLFHKRIRHADQFQSFEDLMEAEVLRDLQGRPSVTSIAIAGRVKDGGRSAFVTNRGWKIEAGRLEALGLGKVVLLNDFEALALSVESLTPDELIPASTSRRRSGDCAVVGPGTGLGVAFLSWTGEHYIVKPGESGHREWPARTILEWNIREHILASRHDKLSANSGAPSPGRVSFEDLLSGRGLANIYRALVALTASQEIPVDVDSARDPAATISLGAQRGNLLCNRALDIFFEVLGVFAGDLALHNVPGGIYLAGGALTNNIEAFLRSGFRRTFLKKSPHEAMVAATPVFVINTRRELGVEGAYRKSLIVVND